MSQTLCLVTHSTTASSAVAPPTQIEANVRKRVIVQRAAGHPFFLLDACVKKPTDSALPPLELRRDCNARRRRRRRRMTTPVTGHA